MKNLNEVKLMPAREMVASAMRRAILSKDMHEGEDITLEGIASQLGVSITPVREAFQILASDGLIKLRPNKGAVVLGINKKFIQDHYETRAILEREAAAMVCRNNADITDIVEAFQQAEAALKVDGVKSVEVYTNYNQAFHMAIWNAAGNEKMKSLLSSMWNGLPMGRAIKEEDYAQISFGEHRAILDAIIARDEDKAKEFMNNHIMRSMENILTKFD